MPFYSPGKIRPGDEYVVFKRPLIMGAKTFEPGHPVDVSSLSRTRVRQLVEWKRIIPKRLYEAVTGMELPKGQTPCTPVDGPRGRDLALDDSKSAAEPAKPAKKKAKKKTAKKAPEEDVTESTDGVSG